MSEVDDQRAWMAALQTRHGRSGREMDLRWGFIERAHQEALDEDRQRYPRWPAPLNPIPAAAESALRTWWRNFKESIHV